MNKVHGGRIFFRDLDDNKTLFIGVMDTPDGLETKENLRSFIMIPGYHQRAMMIIDPGEYTDEFLGWRIDQVACSNKGWETGSAEFDDLPPNIRALLYKFIITEWAF